MNQQDNIGYSRKHDAKFDKGKDEWLESKCSESCHCEFCKDRPVKPSQVKE